MADSHPPPPSGLFGEDDIRLVLDHVAHPIFVKDREFRFVFVNRALSEMLQIPRGEMLGRTDYDFFPPAQADFFRQKDVEMFTQRRTVVIEEEPITDATGRRHLLATTKVPLKDSTGEVAFLVGIIHDITRLREFEEELQRKNEALANEVREKSEAFGALDAAHRDLEAFSYSVSHDLRGPLRAIHGFVALLVQDHADRLDATGLEFLQRIDAGVRRLDRLIHDLLDLSRVTRLEPAREPVLLAPLARSVGEELTRTLAGRVVEFRVEDGPPVRGDLGLLQVVMQNLLSNAWKFTGRNAKSHIEISQERQGAEVVCRVRDDGAGFDAARAGDLFQPFRRLHPAAEFPGTGIGLATVARIVRRHGGRIWAEGAPGRGATIGFSLPAWDAGSP